MGDKTPDINRKISGQFEQGFSGNPKGRPCGISDKRAEIRKLFYSHAEALVNKSIELALAGDTNALRLCMERIFPKAKNDFISLSLQNIDTTKAVNLPEILEQFLIAVSHQEITPEQAKTLSEIIETQRKLIETSELEARVSSIEYALKQSRETKNVKS